MIVVDADTVNYTEGSGVWIQIPGRKLASGTVIGHHPKSGKPLVKKTGWVKPRPVSKVYLRSISLEP